MNRKRISYIIIVLCLTFLSLFGISKPVSADTYGRVRVIIENNSYKNEDAPWTGTLFDTSVDISYGMTMQKAIESAAQKNNITLEGIENNYITGVNGLHAGQGGIDSAVWMGMLNNWFVDRGLNDYQVENGDIIRLIFTCTFGSSEGSLPDSSDTSISSVKFDNSEFKLTPEFSKDVYDYTLALPNETQNISILPEAYNKNFQVRVYNKSNPDTEDKGYKLSEKIPVKPGTVLAAVCGDPSWPSSSASKGASSYRFKISIDGDSNSAPECIAENTEVVVLLGKEYNINLSEIFKDEDSASLTYFVSENGADYKAVEKSYSFSPASEGEYVLTFKASDGEKESDLYEVKIYASNEQGKAININPSDHGSVTSSVGNAIKGTEVALEVNADSSYTLKNLTVKDSDGNNISLQLSSDKKYYFNMPSSSVSVDAVFDTTHKIEIYGACPGSASFLGYLKLFNSEGMEICPTDVPTQKNKPYRFDAAIGNYQYQIFTSDGKVIKNGKIEIKESSSIEKIYLAKVQFLVMDPIYDPYHQYNNGMYIDIIDPDGNEVEFCEEAQMKCEGGGYGSYIYYILEARGQDYVYTYSTRAVDDRVDVSLCTGELSYKIDKVGYIATVIKTHQVQIMPSVANYEHTFKVSKGADLKLTRMQGKAYTEFQEIGWEPVDEISDNNYDIYKTDLPQDMSLCLVAGGKDTEYRKSVFLGMSASKDSEFVLDLERKGSEAKGNIIAASNDLYTNIGNGGYCTMKTNETKRLEGFRVWQTVTDSISNQFVEPQMHYDIIYGDSVELSQEGGIGREYMTMKAVKSGISVIKITYEDMNVYDVGTLNAGLIPTPYYFEPIDQMDTGIVIVNVDGTTGNIQSNIDVTDYDTIYFPSKITYPDGTEELGNDFTTYRFTPTADSGNIKVRVHDPVVDGNGSWADGWTEYSMDAENNSFEIKLKEGRNIIEISSGDNIVYTTINAKKVECTMTNETTSNAVPKIGDTVSIKFDGLELPLYKMCGIYNPGYPDTTWVEYTLNNGDKTVRSPGVQYSINKYNTITFKVEQAGDNVLSHGQIHCAHLGSALDTHLDIPLSGMAPNLNASSGTNDPYFCTLPEIKFHAVGPEADVIEMINNIDESDYLGEVKEIKEAQDAYDKLTDEQKKLVTNYAKLEKAYKAVEPVIKVIRAIEKLPDRVTLNNKNAVDSANDKFAALTEAEKAAVYNQDKLKSLIASIQDLEEQKARIDHVINLIEYLPSVDKLTLDKNVLEAITEAQAAYDKLPADERAQVTNADKLVQIQKRLPNLRAAQPVIDSISAIGKITELNYLDKAALVISARNAYAALTQEQQALVTNLDVLKQAEYDIALFEVDEDVREAMEAIRELTVTFDGQGNKIAGPLTQTAESVTATWDIWASWKDFVANTRGLIELIAADKLSEIENLADLEQAEAYISALEVDDAVKALASLPNADTVGESGAATGTQLTVGDLKAIASAMDTYYNLTDEQKKSLPESSVNNLLALDQKASTYEEYLNDYLQVYVDELADCYVQYKDALLSRTEMTVIQQIVNKYDSYTAENQAALDVMNASASTGLTFAEMRNVLLGQLAQVEEDISVTADLDEWIMSLPTNVTIDNLESVENDIAAIEKQYYGLNKNAKSYIRNKERLNALKAVVSSLRDEINTFTMNNPNLSAVATKYNRVTVAWDEYENAEYYYVYRKTGKKGWKRIAETSTLSYIDHEVRCDMTYRYTVRAVSHKWGKKVLSDYDNGSVKVKTPFGGVTELTSAKSAGYNSVKLTWDKLDNAMGYRIYRASSKNGKFEKIKTIRSRNTQTYIDKGLTCGKTYYYKMRAYDKVGKKVVWASYSEIKSAKPIPAATKIRKIASASKSATLTWKKVSGASGYVVYRASSKNGTYQKVKAVKGGKTITYTDSKLKSKKTYYYKVRAYRKEGKKNIYSKYSGAKLIKID